MQRVLLTDMVSLAGQIGQSCVWALDVHHVSLGHGWRHYASAASDTLSGDLQSCSADQAHLRSHSGSGSGEVFWYDVTSSCER